MLEDSPCASQTIGRRALDRASVRDHQEVQSQGIHLVFNLDAGTMAEFDPSLDITAEVVKQVLLDHLADLGRHPVRLRFGDDIRRHRVDHIAERPQQ